MSIFLGNLNVDAIEYRLGIKLSDEDRKSLIEERQECVSKPLEVGKWHCYDLPFTLMTHDIETAKKYITMFEKYDPLTFKECLQVGWEENEQEHEDGGE